jgi:large subunit ribosomal protein L17
MAVSLITHERIRTTVAKAKELRPFVEKLVTLGKRDSLHARRQALSILPSHKAAVHRLFGEISPRFAERPGGYTRILKLGPRQGDGAGMALIEFVDYKFKGAEAPAPTKAAPAKEAPKAKSKTKKADEASEEAVEAAAAEEKTAKKKKASKKKTATKTTSKKKATKKTTKKKPD